MFKSTRAARQTNFPRNISIIPKNMNFTPSARPKAVHLQKTSKKEKWKTVTRRVRKTANVPHASLLQYSQ